MYQSKIFQTILTAVRRKFLFSVSDVVACQSTSSFFLVVPVLSSGFQSVLFVLNNKKHVKNHVKTNDFLVVVPAQGFSAKEKKQQKNRKLQKVVKKWPDTPLQKYRLYELQIDRPVWDSVLDLIFCTPFQLCKNQCFYMRRLHFAT